MTNVESLSAGQALRQILAPRSVAVVGGSDRAGTMPAALMENLVRHGFTGTVHVVNPNRDSVFGYRSYAHVADLPEVPDTAVVLTGASRVPDALEQAAAFGIGSAIVVAAGFHEGAAGAAGAANAEALERVVANTGIRLIGPNTTGALNALDGYVPKASLNHPAELIPGDLAIVGQSGAIGNALINRAIRNRVGVGYMIATGNQLDLDVWDAAEYVLEDSRIRTLLLVLESVGDVEKMRRVAAAARADGKAVVCLKLGTSKIGGTVVSNHSGALAGSAEVQVAALAREGIVSVATLDEMWEVGALLQHWGAPDRPGAAIGIMSTSGGDAAMGADFAERYGLQLPPPSPDTAELIAREFSFASPSNPFDTTAEFLGRPGLFRTGVQAFLADPAFAATVLSVMIPLGLFGPKLQEDIIAAVADQRASRRLAMALRSGPGHDPADVAALSDHGVPVFEGMETAVRAIANYDKYARLRDAAASVASNGAPPIPDTPPVPDTPVPAARTYWLDRTTLADAGVPFNPARLVETAADAAQAADELGYPIVLKLSTAGSGHKLASGGVRLMLVSAGQVSDAARPMLASIVPDLDAGVGLVVERQVAGIAEIFVGAHRDAQLGPFLILGTGGSWTEALHDIAYAPLPASAEQIRAALLSTRIGGGLARHPETVDAITQAAVSAAAWFLRHPEVTSIDLNPILVSAPGADTALTAVDARLAVDVAITS